VIPFQTLRYHLRQHHRVAFASCNAVLEQYESLPVSQNDADVKPLPHDTPPIPLLGRPVAGYSCKHCPFLTINYSTALRKHVKKAHQRSLLKTDERDFSCFLQRWISYRNVGNYWRVNAASITSESFYPGRDVDVERCDRSVGSSNPQAAALAIMEAEEEARLADEAQGSTSLSDALEHEENTDWLRGCQWPRWFAHKPLHPMIATSRMPLASKDDVHLGSWKGAEWISCSSSEA
jgi:hypothetical protein